MRLPRFNINAPHDWRGDLSICINAMKGFVVFCIIILCTTLAFLPIYNAASRGSQPYDVYTAEDWSVAVNDPFVDTVILHDDIVLTDMPDRRITVFKDFKKTPAGWSVK